MVQAFSEKGREKKMNYPKSVMSLPELKKLGFPVRVLYQAANAKGSGSFKSGSGGKTAVWYFRVDEFDEWLNALAENQKRGR